MHFFISELRIFVSRLVISVTTITTCFAQAQTEASLTDDSKVNAAAPAKTQPLSQLQEPLQQPLQVPLRDSSQNQSRNLFEHMQVSAAVDLTHPIFIEDHRSAENKLNIRSAEMVFYGPIDHVFDGLLNFAGHTDEGEFEFAVHEAHVGSSKLIPRTRFKIGKFFLGVGRLNQLHQHDWPFISAPKSHREFFSPGSGAHEAEVAIDTGAEAAFLFPTQQFIDLTVGVTNGYTYGHSHDTGSKPRMPLHYLRSTTFFTMSDGAGLLLGANYLGRTDSTGTKMTLLGLDSTYKRKAGRILDWFLQSEMWYRTIDSPLVPGTTMLGGYIYPQKGLSEDWALGLRFDALTQLNRTFEPTGAQRANLDYAVVPTFTYQSSEFATLRLAYTHEIETLEGEGDRGEKRFELQFVYLLGAHPAHDC